MKSRVSPSGIFQPLLANRIVCCYTAILSVCVFLCISWFPVTFPFPGVTAFSWSGVGSFPTPPAGTPPLSGCVSGGTVSSATTYTFTTAVDANFQYVFPNCTFNDAVIIRGISGSGPLVLNNVQIEFWGTIFKYTVSVRDIILGNNSIISFNGASVALSSQANVLQFSNLFRKIYPISNGIEFLNCTMTQNAMSGVLITIDNTDEATNALVRVDNSTFANVGTVFKVTAKHDFSSPTSVGIHLRLRRAVVEGFTAFLVGESVNLTVGEGSRFGRGLVSPWIVTLAYTVINAPTLSQGGVWFDRNTIFATAPSEPAFAVQFSANPKVVVAAPQIDIAGLNIHYFLFESPGTAAPIPAGAYFNLSRIVSTLYITIQLKSESPELILDVSNASTVSATAAITVAAECALCTAAATHTFVGMRAFQIGIAMRVKRAVMIQENRAAGMAVALTTVGAATDDPFELDFIGNEVIEGTSTSASLGCVSAATAKLCLYIYRTALTPRASINIERNTVHCHHSASYCLQMDSFGLTPRTANVSFLNNVIHSPSSISDGVYVRTVEAKVNMSGNVFSGGASAVLHLQFYGQTISFDETNTFPVPGLKSLTSGALKFTIDQYALDRSLIRVRGQTLFGFAFLASSVTSTYTRYNVIDLKDCAIGGPVTIDLPWYVQEATVALQNVNISGSAAISAWNNVVLTMDTLRFGGTVQLSANTKSHLALRRVDMQRGVSNWNVVVPGDITIEACTLAGGRAQITQNLPGSTFTIEGSTFNASLFRTSSPCGAFTSITYGWCIEYSRPAGGVATTPLLLAKDNIVATHTSSTNGLIIYAVNNYGSADLDARVEDNRIEQAVGPALLISQNALVLVSRRCSAVVKNNQINVFDITFGLSLDLTDSKLKFDDSNRVTAAYRGGYDISLSGSVQNGNKIALRHQSVSMIRLRHTASGNFNNNIYAIENVTISSSLWIQATNMLNSTFQFDSVNMLPVSTLQPLTIAEVNGFVMRDCNLRGGTLTVLTAATGSAGVSMINTNSVSMTPDMLMTFTTPKGAVSISGCSLFKPSLTLSPGTTALTVRNNRFSATASSISCNGNAAAFCITWLRSSSPTTGGIIAMAIVNNTIDQFGLAFESVATTWERIEGSISDNTLGHASVTTAALLVKLRNASVTIERNTFKSSSSSTIAALMEMTSGRLVFNHTNVFTSPQAQVQIALSDTNDNSFFSLKDATLHTVLYTTNPPSTIKGASCETVVLERVTITSLLQISNPAANRLRAAKFSLRDSVISGSLTWHPGTTTEQSDMLIEKTRVVGTASMDTFLSGADATARIQNCTFERNVLLRLSGSGAMDFRGNNISASSSLDGVVVENTGMLSGMTATFYQNIIKTTASFSGLNVLFFKFTAHGLTISTLQYPRLNFVENSVSAGSVSQTICFEIYRSALNIGTSNFGGPGNFMATISDLGVFNLHSSNTLPSTQFSTVIQGSNTVTSVDIDNESLVGQLYCGMGTGMLNNQIRVRVSNTQASLLFISIQDSLQEFLVSVNAFTATSSTGQSRISAVNIPTSGTGVSPKSEVTVTNNYFSGALQFGPISAASSTGTALSPIIFSHNVLRESGFVTLLNVYKLAIYIVRNYFSTSAALTIFYFQTSQEDFIEFFGNVFETKAITHKFSFVTSSIPGNAAPGGRTLFIRNTFNGTGEHKFNTQRKLLLWTNDISATASITVDPAGFIYIVANTIPSITVTSTSLASVTGQWISGCNFVDGTFSTGVYLNIFDMRFSESFCLPAVTFNQRCWFGPPAAITTPAANVLCDGTVNTAVMGSASDTRVLTAITTPNPATTWMSIQPFQVPKYLLPICRSIETRTSSKTKTSPLSTTRTGRLSHSRSHKISATASLSITPRLTQSKSLRITATRSFGPPSSTFSLPLPNTISLRATRKSHSPAETKSLVAIRSPSPGNLTRTVSAHASSSHSAPETLSLSLVSVGTVSSRVTDSAANSSSTHTNSRSNAVTATGSIGPIPSVSGEETATDSQSSTRPALRTITLPPTRSRQPTATPVPPPTEAPIPPPPAFTSRTGNSPYGSRYVDYDAQRLFGSYSGIPLQFTETFRDIYGQRFRLSGKPLNNWLRFPTKGINSAAPLFQLAGISKTSGVEGYVVNGLPLVSPRIAPIPVDALSNWATDISASICGELMTTVNTTRPSTKIPFADSVFVAAGTVATSSAVSTPCTDGPLLSGLTYSTVPFSREATMSYLVLRDENTPLNGTAMRNDFIASEWRGAPSPLTASRFVPFNARLLRLVGDPNNTFRLPVPIISKAATFLHDTQQSASNPIIISANTSDAVACAMGHMFGYDALLVPANFTSNHTKGGIPQRCFMFDTVDDLHATCDADNDCIGFTSIRMPGPRELPLCLYKTGSNAAHDMEVYDRMMYKKPAIPQKQCEVQVERSGFVTVYIQQTTMAVGQVIVRVGSNVVGVCGGSSPFTNSFNGMSGICNAYALCFADRVPTNAIISVTAPTGLQQGLCNSSLGVLIHQTAVDSTQVAAATELPIERYNVSHLPSRRVRKTTFDTYPATLFVYRGQEAALDVTQSGYDCALYEVNNGGAGSCPTNTIQMSSKSSCQTCGGKTGFFRNSRNGYSDRCEQSMLCSGFMTLDNIGSSSGNCKENGAATTPQPYTGTLRINANVEKLSALSKQCVGLEGRVYVNPSYVSQTIPVFPLLDGADDKFRIHLAIPIGSSLDTLYTALNLTTAEDKALLTKITTTGSIGAPLDVIFVPWNHLFPADGSRGTPQDRLPGSITQVCIVDHSLEQTTQCSFFTPRSATRVAVSVSQTDFLSSENYVDVAIRTGTTVHAQQRCGGGSASKFGLDLGSQERCSTFSTCVDRFLYANDASSGSSIGTVVVDIPPNIRPRTCDFVATVIAQFTAPQVSVPSCPEYECPGERKCLARSQLCDQIQDCLDNSDEKQCVGLNPVPNFGFCVPDDYGTVYTAPSFTDCQRRAVAAGSTTFVHTVSSSKCVVYNASVAALVFENPTHYVCERTGSTAYVSLPGGINSLKKCLPSIHCSGHGRVVATVSPPCQCVCDDGFFGSACSDRLSLDRITYVVVGIVLGNLQESAAINLAVLEDSLTMRSSVIKVSCSDVAPLNTTTVLIECAVTSSSSSEGAIYVHSRKILDSRYLIALNEPLSRIRHPLIRFVTSRTTMNPLIPVFSCNTTGDASGGQCAADRNFDGLRIVTVRNTSATRIRVVIQEPSASFISAITSSSSSRASAGRFFEGEEDAHSLVVGPSISRREVFCDPVGMNDEGGCVTSMCDVPIKGSRQAIVSVQDVAYAPETLLTTECLNTEVTAMTQVSFGNIPTNTNSTVKNVEGDFQAFLFASIGVFFVGGIIFSVTAAICGCCHACRLRKSLSNVVTKEFSRLEKEKMTLLARLHAIKMMLVNRQLRLDRCSVFFFVFALFCSLGAGFLSLYYYSSYDLKSNFSIMYEEYSDDQCSMSRTAYMPRRIFAVPPGSTECTKMQAIGEAAGVVFGTGRCVGSASTGYKVTIQMGGSSINCGRAPSVTVPSGSCLPIRSYIPFSDRSIFVSVTCSNTEFVASRTRELEVLTTVPDIFVDAPIKTPRPALLLYNETISTSGSGSGGGLSSLFSTKVAPADISDAPNPTAFRYQYVVGSAVVSASSFYKNTVDSQASAADFDNNYDASRLVLQDSRYTFGYGLGTEMDTTQSLFSASMANLESTTSSSSSSKNIRLYGSALQDQPIGHIFNGFGTSSPVTWVDASASSHKYYGIRGSVFDMGKYFPKDPKNLEEGEGYSVSMYLRVDDQTLGFAYAVTDAFENTQNNIVYTLNRLAKIIDNGQSGNVWFNTTYRVYHSLYVNGPGRSLVFAYADPDAIERVHLLEFDLERIGMGRLMNGLWHHVSIVLRVENGRARGQLIVDGETSYAKAGWSACIDAFSKPMTPVKAPGKVYDILTDTISDGGLLVTGYFNGGLYALRARPEPLQDTTILFFGTDAMRSNNNFPRTHTIILGAGLFVMGVICLLLVSVIGYRNINELHREANRKANNECAVTFYKLQMKMMRSGKLFGRHIDDEDEDFWPIRLTTALRLTKLTPSKFTIVMAEVMTQTRYPGERLLLLIMHAATGNRSITKFGTADWNDFVEDDQKTFTNTRRFLCIKPVSDRAVEVDLCGRDWYNMVFKEGYPIMGEGVIDDAGEASKIHQAGDSADSLDENDPQQTQQRRRKSTANGKESKRKDSYKEDKMATAEGGARDAGVDGSGEAFANAPPSKSGASFSQGIGGTGGGIFKTFSDVMSPVFVVFQTMAVWSTAIEFPSLYEGNFKEVFNVMSADFTKAFAFAGDIPAVVTPLAQLGLGLIAIGFVLYYMIEDNRIFDRNLAQYVWRRDEIEGSKRMQRGQKKFPKHLRSALRDDKVPEALLPMDTLPIVDARRIDIFTGKMRKVHEGDKTDYNSLNKLDAFTADGDELMIERSRLSGSGAVVALAEDTIKKGKSVDLEELGIFCRRHPSVRLSPQLQTVIWPFAHPPVCGVVVNGMLCGEQCGTVYSCGEEYTDEATGTKRVCNYALCAHHCRLNTRQKLLSRLTGLKRSLARSGVSWLMCVVIVFLANAAYTPFIKTALMIIGCHPYYQCEFNRCWDNMDQKYLLALYLSFVILAVFGLGFPVAMYLLLSGRKTAMRKTFLDPEYEGKYTATTTPCVGKPGIGNGEWARFVSTDPTAMAQHYQQVFYDWMFFPAMMIMIKVATLVPAVYLEPHSFTQRVGIAGIELGIALFMFTTTTQLSPILVVTIRIASVHQLLILGLQNLSLVRLHDSNEDLSLLMVGVTLLYLVFSIIVFLFMTVVPFFSSVATTNAIKKFLNDHGYDYSAGITLYLNPLVHAPGDGQADQQQQQQKNISGPNSHMNSRRGSLAILDTNGNDNVQTVMKMMNGAGGGVGGGMAQRRMSAFAALAAAQQAQQDDNLLLSGENQFGNQDEEDEEDEEEMYQRPPTIGRRGSLSVGKQQQEQHLKQSQSQPSQLQQSQSLSGPPSGSGSLRSLPSTQPPSSRGGTASSVSQGSGGGSASNSAAPQTSNSTWKKAVNTFSATSAMAATTAGQTQQQRAAAGKTGTTNVNHSSIASVDKRKNLLASVPQSFVDSSDDDEDFDSTKTTPLRGGAAVLAGTAAGVIASRTVSAKDGVSPFHDVILQGTADHPASASSATASVSSPHGQTAAATSSSASSPNHQTQRGQYYDSQSDNSRNNSSISHLKCYRAPAPAPNSPNPSTGATPGTGTATGRMPMIGQLQDPSDRRNKAYLRQSVGCDDDDDDYDDNEYDGYASHNRGPQRTGGQHNHYYNSHADTLTATTTYADTSATPTNTHSGYSSAHVSRVQSTAPQYQGHAGVQHYYPQQSTTTTTSSGGNNALANSILQTFQQNSQQHHQQQQLPRGNHHQQAASAAAVGYDDDDDYDDEYDDYLSGGARRHHQRPQQQQQHQQPHHHSHMQHSDRTAAYAATAATHHQPHHYQQQQHINGGGGGGDDYGRTSSAASDVDVVHLDF